MKAPDKIYLHGYEFDDEPCKNWEREPKVKGMRGYPAIHVEYIRKNALLEWAIEELEKRRNTGDDYFYPAIVVLNDIIDKIEQL